MPELLLELFSEEIPARMQQGAAATLARLLTESLAPLAPSATTTFYGPRRIALSATLATSVPAASVVERGPRTSAPPQALDGFLRKHAATSDQVTDENGHWVLTKSSAETPAAALIAQILPALLRRFPWPKSMRWGDGSLFTWVRPLRRITCILDGAIVPFTLTDGADDGHHLASGNQTEGHRFHAPGAFTVSSRTKWERDLLTCYVVPDAGERRRRIVDGIARLAAAEHLTVVPDEGLLDEVTGLVEWPVPLLGRIDDAYMDLPPEVMQVSMRVNQRYFALRTQAGAPAPRFAFAANIEASDGGATIIAGNERVLRARFSDARHFWDLDRRTRLEDRLPALEGVTFHAKIGTQAARVRRIEALARHLAQFVGAAFGIVVDPSLAARAARLSKADLTTGMVGEFPELQGVMGSYYARHDGEPAVVANAIRDHYTPRGPSDPTPIEPVTIVVALADKLDQLASFFAAGEIPTGSGDPFALRRAALGVIRIVRENKLRVPLRADFRAAGRDLADPVPIETLVNFVVDRLLVQLRTEGARHDVLSAVFAAGADDDLVRLLARTEAVTQFLETPDGADLLTGARRAANILRIEDKKDGPHQGPIDPERLTEPTEQALNTALNKTEASVKTLISEEKFVPAMGHLAQLRPTVEKFFDDVTVNAPDPSLRRNRLRLLARVGAVMALAADFSQIQG